jgi:hypothetical protein
MTAYSVGERRRAHKARANVSLHHMDGETITAPPPEDNRPTPERMTHGEFVVGKVGSMYSDLEVSHMRAALRETVKAKAAMPRLDLRWRMTERRVAAGERYEQHWRTVNGSVGPGDSLDFTIRGGHETGPEFAARTALNERRITREIPPGHRVVLLDVCVIGNPTGKRTPARVRWRWLIDGLDMLAEVFGLE